MSTGKKIEIKLLHIHSHTRCGFRDNPWSYTKE